MVELERRALVEGDQHVVRRRNHAEGAAGAKINAIDAARVTCELAEVGAGIPHHGTNQAATSISANGDTLALTVPHEVTDLETDALDLEGSSTEQKNDLLLQRMLIVVKRPHADLSFDIYSLSAAG